MGIARKTFFFTAGLIALVVIVSLSILYFILPDYYFRSKTARIEKQTDVLARKLRESRSKEDCASLIREFTSSNNAAVLSFEPDDAMIFGMSSPFLSLGPDIQVQMILKGAAEPSVSSSVVEGFHISGVNPNPAPGEISAYSGGAPGIYSSVNQLSFERSIQNGIMDHIRIVCTMQPVGEATQVIISLLPYLLILDLLIALPAAYFYSKRLTKPILKLSHAASQMREMTPGVVSGINTRDELGELSSNLDLLYQSLRTNIETLRREKEIVNQLEQAKTDFMRAASHELKTPITALNGIVEGMIDSVGIYKNKEKYLHECKNLIDRLSGLVSEILNAAAMDSSEEYMVSEPADVDIIIKNALEENHILYDKKRLIIVTDIEPIRIDTDETVLYHTILNLISNAVKYTPEGGLIRILLQREEDGCILSIENQCEPIAKDLIERLFEPFFTLSYSRDKNKSGTGLGLYIVKKNLEKLNLDYSLENSDIGLRFTILLH